jgi:hypothetical protein
MNQFCESFPEKCNGVVVGRINVTKLISDLTEMNVFPLKPDAADRATLADAVKALSQLVATRAVLERYMNAYPAFRIKPNGAPGSQVRNEQERLMALEDEAKAVLA